MAEHKGFALQEAKPLYLTFPKVSQKHSFQGIWPDLIHIISGLPGEEKGFLPGKTGRKWEKRNEHAPGAKQGILQKGGKRLSQAAFRLFQSKSVRIKSTKKWRKQTKSFLQKFKSDR